MSKHRYTLSIAVAQCLLLAQSGVAFAQTAPPAQSTVPAPAAQSTVPAPAAATPEPSIFHTSTVQVDRTAHVWIVVGTQRHELNAASVRNAKSATSAGGMSGGGMMGGVANTAMSLAGMAAGPIVGMAASALGMFGLGRPHRTAPSIRDTWALEGTRAAISVAAQTPSFELSYGDLSGVDPDAYEPVLVKLTPTSDNWRVAAQTEREISSGGVSGPTFSEKRLPIHVESLGRGHVRISPDSALEPGQYGVALRPLKRDGGDQAALPSPMSMMMSRMPVASGGTMPMTAAPAELWQSMWDFEVEAPPAPSGS